jgi:hypothetical protein
VRCLLAPFLADLTARLVPASAAMSKRTRSPASVLRAHRPRVLAQIVGVGEHGPERRPAQQRRHRGSADIAQLAPAASRRPQQPRADARLEALNLLKVAHQAPPTHA